MNVSGLALVLALVAVGVAAYGLSRDDAGPTQLETRIEALEDQLSKLAASLAAREQAEESAPTLMGHALAPQAPSPEAARAAHARPSDGAAGTSAVPTTQPAEQTAEEIQQLVDKAVEKKTEQIRTMENKKPSIDAFAATIELTPEQRERVEREVTRAQHAIKDILEIRTEDGTNFLDEFVEVLADGMARPGKNPGRGMKLFGRLLTERIPGTDETYAARVESVKKRLRGSFRGYWSEGQYATLETWKMDPTEIRDIPGSPWKDVESRVVERAKELGTDLPDPDGR